MNSDLNTVLYTVQDIFKAASWSTEARILLLPQALATNSSAETELQIVSGGHSVEASFLPLPIQVHHC